MARHANVKWNLPEGVRQPDGSTTHKWEAIHSALLMDLRDELQSLNVLLHCSNFVNIPAKLERIARNTEKKSKRKKA